MQQTTVKLDYHNWTEDEKSQLQMCECRQEIRAFAQNHGLSYLQALSMFKYLGYGPSKLATFDYSNPRPLKMLFSRCPNCGGTTTVNETAYCRSCLSTWHAISLQPMTYVDKDGKVHGLHEPDRI